MQREQTSLTHTPPGHGYRCTIEVLQWSLAPQLYKRKPLNLLFVNGTEKQTVEPISVPGLEESGHQFKL